MKVIGLTGGIGVGKSTVAKLFLNLGIPTLDADQVARKLREPGEAGHTAILTRFGTTDRKTLRALIASDPIAKADLESILHPLIRQKSDESLKELKIQYPNAPFILYEATLLIEAGRAQDFDGILLVTAPLPDRISRIMARDLIEKDAALALIDAQSPDSFRLNHAQYHIQNLGSLDDLQVQVRKVLDQINSA
jgi:dephospho-CoA kinase